MFHSLLEIHRQVLQLVEVELKWQQLVWWRKDLLALQERPGIWGQWTDSEHFFLCKWLN